MIGCVYVHIQCESLGTGCVGRIFNPPFPVLKAGHSVSYSCVCDVCREWVNEVGFFLFFLNFPVWLVVLCTCFSCTCTLVDCQHIGMGDEVKWLG